MARALRAAAHEYIPSVILNGTHSVFLPFAVTAARGGPVAAGSCFLFVRLEQIPRELVLIKFDSHSKIVCWDPYQKAASVGCKSRYTLWRLYGVAAPCVGVIVHTLSDDVPVHISGGLDAFNSIHPVLGVRGMAVQSCLRCQEVHHVSVPNEHVLTTTHEVRIRTNGVRSASSTIRPRARLAGTCVKLGELKCMPLCVHVERFITYEDSSCDQLRSARLLQTR